MKIQLDRIGLVLFVLILGLSSGCTGSGAPIPTPTTPEIQIKATPTENPDSALVLDMVKHLNDGDFEGSLNFFAPDARIYFVGMPPAGMEIYRGIEALRLIWEDCANNHFKWEVEITSSNNGIVTAKTKTWHDFTRQLGVAPNEFTDVFIIKDGKITTYTSTMTEDSLAEFKPALAAVMPPAEITPAPTESPVSKLSFETSDGTCAYTGSMVLQAGNIDVAWTVKDQDGQNYALTFFTLDTDKDIVDLMAASTRPSPPSWSKMIFYKELAGGSSQTYNLTVKQGSFYVVCWTQPTEAPIAAIGPFEVVP